MFQQGNAHDDGAPFGRWFIGDLGNWSRGKPGNFGLRQSGSVEVKWGLHPKGDQRVEWAACSQKVSMSLLVRGKFLVRFRSPANREEVTEVRFLREGDYAIWGTDVEHTWVVEEEAVILTVRWNLEPM